MLSLPHGPTLTSIQCYWKNRSFDYTNLSHIQYQTNLQKAKTRWYKAAILHKCQVYGSSAIVSLCWSLFLWGHCFCPSPGWSYWVLGSVFHHRVGPWPSQVFPMTFLRSIRKELVILIWDCMSKFCLIIKSTKRIPKGSRKKGNWCHYLTFGFWPDRKPRAFLNFAWVHMSWAFYNLKLEVNINWYIWIKYY